MENVLSHSYNILKIKQKSFFYIIFAMIILIVLMHVFNVFCWYTKVCGIAMGPVNRFGYLFDMNREMNIPTWFSVVQLFATACALVVAALAQKLKSHTSNAWWGLAGIFFYMSLDEATDLHGFWRLDAITIPGAVHSSFSWVVPASVLVVVIASLYVKWLITLPRRTCMLFFIAGCVYICGALVFELIGAYVTDETYFNIEYIFASTIEETLEIFGIYIMFYAVIDYLNIIGLNIALYNDK